MIENGVMRVGGNTLKVWFWNSFANLGLGLQNLGLRIENIGKERSLKNRAKVVANPTAKLINPFTMIVSFTVDVNEKYQIVLQGDYKQNYKDCVDGAVSIAEENLFLIINQHQKEWFKKE